MKKYTQEELEKKYASLPAKLRDLALSEDITDKLFKLGIDVGLTEDQSLYYADLMQLVFLGVEPRKDMAKMFETSLETTPDIASTLALATEQRILAPVSAELDQVQEKVETPIAVMPKPDAVLPPIVNHVTDKKKISIEEAQVLWSKLPVDVQSMIGSTDLSNDLQAIMQSNGLHADEAGEVENLVGMTLIGALSSRDFLTKLKSLLPDKPEDKIYAVAEAVNKRIFFKAQEKLRVIVDSKPMPPPSEVMKIPEMPPEIKITPTPVAPPPPVPVIPVAPAPVTAAIHELKMTLPTETPSVKKDVSYINTDPKLKMIPDDVKTRINSDPYKEPIE